MNTFQGERTKPLSKGKVKYTNDSCVGIEFAPIDESETHGRIPILSIIMTVSVEDAVEIAKDILKRYEQQ